MIAALRHPLHRIFHTPEPRDPEEQANTKAYQKAVWLAPPEPAPYHGMVYEEQPSGFVRTLKLSGQTSPTTGPDGPDIPAADLKNNRVFFYVDGIHVPLAQAETDVQKLFETEGDPLLTHVGQPTIGIQEGVGLTYVNDMARIGKDFEIMKAYQGDRAVPGSADLAYQVDPAVKSVHDEIKQSLDAGREVLLAGHSGGGMDSALALTILAHEGYKDAISQHVRLLEIAPASAPEDYYLAGVKPDNLYYTGSHKDPVYELFHTYVPPDNQAPQVGLDVGMLLSTLARPNPTQYHSAYYIFSQNVSADGQTNNIQTFLDGGPGGLHGF